MSIMATETQQACVYVHHTRYTTQHVLRVFLEDVLDDGAPAFGARIDKLRQELWQLKRLQVHVYEYRMTVIWWAPQGTYRPRHLNAHEAQELVAKKVVEALTSLYRWPVPPHVVHVRDLVELLDIKRTKNVDWGLGRKTT